MDMSGMSHHGSGSVTAPSIHRGYWELVGAVIAIATIANILNYMIYRQRMSAVSSKHKTPAKPENWVMRHYAGFVAVMREAANAAPSEFTLGGLFHSLSRTKKSDRQESSNPVLRYRICLPSFGSVFLIVANFIALIVMCFHGLSPTNRVTIETLAVQIGHVSAIQIPLIVVLAGRNNLIGFVTGISYERLNWLHRWCARCLWVTATMHLGYWLTDWAPYGDFASYKIKTDILTTTGFSSWCVLTWIMITSALPVRGRWYELFVIQHLLSFGAFLALVFYHLPIKYRFLIWLPVGFVVFDRVARLARLLYLNTAWFHRKSNDNTDSSNHNSILACRASFTPLEHDTTRIAIENPPLQSWRPGQHLFLSFPAITPFQAHPFTIASIPKDKKLEFIVKAHSGATRKFLNHARKQAEGLPTHAADLEPYTTAVTMEGPYGSLRPPEQFDTVVLFAGSTGGTFCIPILRDIVARWEAMYSPSQSSFVSSFTPSILVPSLTATTKIRLVWAVKSRHQLGWFCQQLSEAMECLESLRKRHPDIPELELAISIYVTCDDAYVGEHHQSLHTPSQQQPCSPIVIQERDITEERRDWKETKEIADYGSIASSSGDINKDDTALPPIETDITESRQEAATTGCCCCRDVAEEDGPVDGPEVECHCGDDPDMVCGGGESKSNPSKSRNTEGSEPSDIPVPLFVPAVTTAPLGARPPLTNTKTDDSAGANTFVSDNVRETPSISTPVPNPSSKRDLEQQSQQPQNKDLDDPRTSITVVLTPTNPPVHPHIRVLTGRPSPHSILLQSLEHATGETAVIVCGPLGMITDIRASTVKLSDERAAGRSTGAMGIWFFEEGFGY